MTSEDSFPSLTGRSRRPPPQITPAAGHELESGDAETKVPAERPKPTKQPPTVARKPVDVPRRVATTDDREFNRLWDIFHRIVEVH
jgi:hypothetical protein